MLSDNFDDIDIGRLVRIVGDKYTYITEYGVSGHDVVAIRNNQRKILAAIILLARRALRECNCKLSFKDLRLTDLRGKHFPKLTPDNIKKEMAETQRHIAAVRLANVVGHGYGSRDTEYYSACGYDDYIYESRKWSIIQDKLLLKALGKAVRHINKERK